MKVQRTKAQLLDKITDLKRDLKELRKKIEEDEKLIQKQQKELRALRRYRDVVEAALT